MYRWVDLALAFTFTLLSIVFGTNGLPLLCMASLAGAIVFGILGVRPDSGWFCNICGRKVIAGRELCYWCSKKFEEKS